MKRSHSILSKLTLAAAAVSASFIAPGALAGAADAARISANEPALLQSMNPSPELMPLIEEQFELDTLREALVGNLARCTVNAQGGSYSALVTADAADAMPAEELESENTLVFFGTPAVDAALENVSVSEIIKLADIRIELLADTQALAQDFFGETAATLKQAESELGSSNRNYYAAHNIAVSGVSHGLSDSELFGPVIRNAFVYRYQNTSDVNVLDKDTVADEIVTSGSLADSDTTPSNTVTTPSYRSALRTMSLYSVSTASTTSDDTAVVTSDTTNVISGTADGTNPISVGENEKAVQTTEPTVGNEGVYSGFSLDNYPGGVYLFTNAGGHVITGLTINENVTVVYMNQWTNSLTISSLSGKGTLEFNRWNNGGSMSTLTVGSDIDFAGTISLTRDGYSDWQTVRNTKMVLSANASAATVSMSGNVDCVGLYINGDFSLGGIVGKVGVVESNTGSAVTLTLAGTGEYTYSGKVGSSANPTYLNLSKTGSGTQTFSGTTYLNNLTVSNGTLTFGGTANVAGTITLSDSGAVVVNESGVLNFTTATDGANYAQISGAGTVKLALTDNWDNTVTLGDSFTGTANITSGKFTITKPYVDSNSDNVVGSNIGSGTYNLDDGVHFQVLGTQEISNNIVFNGTHEFHTNGHTLTLSGNITGTESSTLVKQAGGDVVFSGEVNLGKLYHNNGNINISGTTTVTTYGGAYANTSGAGRELNINQAGVLTITGSVNSQLGGQGSFQFSNWPGHTVVNVAGVLNIQNAGISNRDGSGAININNGGEVNFGAGITLTDHNATDIPINLNGGRLNIGADANGVGIENDEDIVLNLNGGTVGSLSDAWSTAKALTISGDVTIDTTKMAFNSTGNATATETGSTISLLGGISVAAEATLNVSGLGKLQLSETISNAGTVNFASGVGLDLANLAYEVSTDSGNVLHTYRVIENSGTGSFSGFNSTNITNVSGYFEGVRDGTETWAFDDNGNVVVTTTAKELTWDNPTGDAIWNAYNSENLDEDDWTSGEGNIAFANGDSVVFNSGATLTIDSSVTVGNLTVSSGTVTLSSVADANATITASGISVAKGATLTINNAIVGAGILKKVGDGTLVLSGDNGSFTGKLLVSGGTVKLGSNKSLGAGYSESHTTKVQVEVATGGTLDLNGQTKDGFYGNYVLSGGSLVNNGTEIGSGSRQLAGGITLTADSWIGGTANFGMISGGWGDNVLYLNGHKLTKTGTNTFWMTNTTVKSGSFDISDGTVEYESRRNQTISASISLVNEGKFNVTKTGDGTLLFDGANVEITTLYMQTGAIAIGSEGKQSLVTANRMELGDAASSGTNSLTINAGSTLKVTGSNNDDNYKQVSIILGEWSNGTTTNVVGTLLAKDAEVRLGDQGANITIDGILAAKGIGRAKSDKYGQGTFGLTLNDDGVLILGASGLVNGKQQGSVALNAGTIAAYADNMTLERNMVLNSTTTGTIFDTQKYAFADDGNSISRVTDDMIGNTITVSSVLSGSGKLVKTGAGTLVLSGANTYTGETTISGGTLTLSETGTLGNGTGAVTVAENATLDLAGTATLSNAITNSGLITSSGTNTLSGVLSGSGDINVQKGSTLTLNLAQESSGSIRAYSISGTMDVKGTVNVKGNYRLDIGSGGKMLLHDGAVVTRAEADTSIGSSAYWIQGTLEVAENATASFVSVDDIHLSHQAQGGNITLNTGSTLNFNVQSLQKWNSAIVNLGDNSTLNFVCDLDDSTTSSAPISGAGSLKKSGAGTLTLTNTNSYSGGTTINGGTLKITNKTALGNGAITVEQGGTLELAVDMSDMTYQYVLDGGTLNSTAVTSDGSAQIFAGEAITLKANSTIKTDRDMGMIASRHAANTLTLNGHTLTKSGNSSFWLSHTTINDGTIDITAGSITLVHASDSDGSKANFVLSGNADNSVSGTLDLRDFNFSVKSLSGTAGTVSLGSGTLTIVGSEGTDTYSFAGAIDGVNGNLVKNGNETLELNGETNLSSLAVNAGTLELGGTTTVSGALTVANGADLKIASQEVSAASVTLAHGAEIVVDLNDFNIYGDSVTLTVLTLTKDSLNLQQEAAALSLAAKTAKNYSNLSEYCRVDGLEKYSQYTSHVWAYDYENGVGVLTLTLAIPEPTTFGFLSGLAALVFVGGRRRKRKTC